jgi:hypothetical protein
VLDIKECKVETLSNQIEQLRAELDALNTLHITRNMI